MSYKRGSNLCCRILNLERMMVSDDSDLATGVCVFSLLRVGELPLFSNRLYQFKLATRGSRAERCLTPEFTSALGGEFGLSLGLVTGFARGISGISANDGGERVTEGGMSEGGEGGGEVVKLLI